MTRRADILMITYRSAGYLHLSLPRLLETLGPQDRVWLWQNGDDEPTIEALRPFRKDDRVHRYHHSRDNARLREPTVWMWQESTAEYVSKVDDDCLVSPEWLNTFESAHTANPAFGAVGSWRHFEEEFRPELAQKKIHRFNGGHQLMLNHWVQGSGYLLKRALIDRHGVLRPKESFTQYCLRLAMSGAVNGFYYPFVTEEHMDDPRSPHTLIHSDADLTDRLPLSAQVNNVRTVADWTEQQVHSAYLLQAASLDLRRYRGWRRRMREAVRRLDLALGRTARW